jgi:polyphosphate glucokinase
MSSEGQSSEGQSSDGKPVTPAPGPTTLAIDVGGSGVKASVLDSAGEMLVPRVRLETPYPCPPDLLVTTLRQLVEPLPEADRISVGFPGLVRSGKVVNVPAFSRLVPGGPADPGMVEAWHAFPLEARLKAAFQKPLILANDADVQGCAVVSGKGFELVLTLGTGVGVALFDEGLLLPHLELSHGPFRKHESFDIHLGDAALKEVGVDRWNERVHKALPWFDDMVYPDRVYLGGGNAKKVKGELPPHVEVVSNTAGILGGIRLWERHSASPSATGID